MRDRLKILLIDDDEEDFLIVSDMLAESGGRRYALEWVNTYDQGLAVIKRKEHDVYLLDYLLGARNGLDLLIEAISTGCEAPIIFLTAYGNYDVDLQAMKAGSADYLVKGEFTSQLLERTIRYSIERKNAEEELKRHRQNLENLVRERTLQHAEARADAERRAIEAEERQAVVKALLEHIPEGIIIVDAPDLKILALSSYALQQECSNPGNYVGRSATDFLHLFSHPQNGQIGLLNEFPIVRAALEGQTIANEEWLFNRPDGSSVPILVSTGPIRDGSGRITGAVAAWRDVSELKKIERELQESRLDLETRVYRRTLELAKAMESLRDSELQLKNLTAQLIKAQEDERKRIAREMHDSIGSSLSAVKFCLENAAQQMKHGLAGPELLTQLSSVVEHSIEESRRIMTDLRPSILDDLGIIVTIGWFCRRYQSIYTGTCIEEKIQIDEADVPEHLKIIIFRIIQEAMNNAAKYSNANNIVLSLAKNGSCIELRIEDDGIGFDLAAAVRRFDASGGLGLTSMKERAELSGGRFELRSALGGGTKIRVCWNFV